MKNSALSRSINTGSCIDDVRLSLTGYAHDLASEPATFAANLEMNDQVDAGGDRWYDKASAMFSPASM